MLNISASTRSNSLASAVNNSAAVVELADQPVQPITITAKGTMVLLTYTHTTLSLLFFYYKFFANPIIFLCPYAGAFTFVSQLVFYVPILDSKVCT